MKTEETVDLIKGEFTPDEAKVLLFSIIGDKIKFNNRQILSLEERNVGDPERFRKRREELRVAQESVFKLIEEARTANKSFEIEAEIKIRIV